MKRMVMAVTMAVVAMVMMGCSGHIQVKGDRVGCSPAEDPNCTSGKMNLSDKLAEMSKQSVPSPEAKYTFIVEHDKFQDVRPPYDPFGTGRFEVNPYLHIKNALINEYANKAVVYSAKNPGLIAGEKVTIKTIDEFEIWKPFGYFTKGKYTADVNGKTVQGYHDEIIATNKESNMRRYLDKVFSDFAKKIKEIYP